MALAGAVAVPLLRKKRPVPHGVTMAAVVSGPPALAILAPRNKLRDAGLYALQMWAFFVGHELPYDDPDALRARLKIDYPIKTDRLLGFGKLPGTRLQKALAHLGRNNPVDRSLSIVHWAWFFEPHSVIAYILLRHPERFARSARQMALVYDIGCTIYATVPTAPPWWAAQEGHTDPDEMRRIMTEVGEEFWGDAWPVMFDTLDGNPWAAMPSLHFAASLMAGLLLAESSQVEGVAGLTYAAVLGFALVYLGEHYVTDLIAGAALVAFIRLGEPHAEPYALAVNRVIQRLERIANS